ASTHADSLTLFSIGDQEPYSQASWQWHEFLGIHGNTVVGQARTSSITRPFVYNVDTGVGTVFGNFTTVAGGVHGQTVVGSTVPNPSPNSYTREGFIFDGASLSTIVHPQTTIYPILDTVIFDYDGERYLGAVGVGY